MGGAGPSPPASASATQSTPKLTENATGAPEFATPTALKVGNKILNLTLPMGLGDQELPANINSDVMSEDSSGVNDDESTYLESIKKSPAIENTTLYLMAIIEETGNILKVFSEGLEHPNAPMVLFNQDDELGPMEIVAEEETQKKTPRQWWDAAAPKSTSLSIFTPGRFARRHGLTSAGRPKRR